MFEFIFIILLLGVFGKILGFAIRAAWGISKIIVTIFLIPLCLVILVLQGLLYVALPVLAVVGLLAILKCKD